MDRSLEIPPFFPIKLKKRARVFEHFLTGEKALTPENVAAASRFGAWVKSRSLPGPAPVAVAWVLSRPQVASAIIGASRIEQLND